MNAKLTAENALQAQLDRLVAGDLPENDRRSLLAWLDEDVSRWRACALAFLEAQSWEAAIGDGLLAGTEKNATAAIPVQKPQSPRGRVAWWQALSLAAAAVLLLVAGHFSARLWSPAAPSIVKEPPAAAPDSSGPLLASVPVRTNLSPNLPAQLQIAVAPSSAAALPGPTISDYERKQWAKRGFELQEERRYLPAKLPDGTTVLVPVDKVQLKVKRSPVS